MIDTVVNPYSVINGGIFEIKLTVFKLNFLFLFFLVIFL